MSIDQASIPTFRQVFDAMGTPDTMRSSEHFYWEHLPDGRAFPIPRQILIGDEIWDLNPSGAVYAEGAEVAADAIIGPRASIGRRAVVHSGATVGKMSEVGECSTVCEKAVLEASVSLGAYSSVGKEAFVGEGTRTEDHVQIEGGVWGKDKLRTEIGKFSSIGMGSKIRTAARLGWHNKLGKEVDVKTGTVTGDGVVMGDGVLVEIHTHIEEGSELMAQTETHKAQTIRRDTLVYPRKFKRARKEKFST